MSLPNKQFTPTLREREAYEKRAIQFTQALNQAQQAFYIKNGYFAPTQRILGTDIPVRTHFYRYDSIGSHPMAVQLAVSESSWLRSVSGGVMPDDQGNWVMIVCLALSPGPQARPPIAQNGRLTCAAGTEPVR
jgi:stage V sporulation protein SpoVS